MAAQGDGVVTTLVNWPLIWIGLGLSVGTGLALYGLSADLFSRRSDERTRSDSEPQ